MIFIGDMHSSWTDYKSILQKQKRLGNITYQVGDLGLGFMPVPEDYKSWIDPEQNKFIRGNHDKPSFCTPDIGYLGDYGVHHGDNHTMFYLSGAYSLDANMRTEGIDWWRDEELSYKSLMDAIKVYATAKTDIVLSHCAPMVVKRKMGVGNSNSMTETALDNMFNIYQPKLWVFGHYHQWFDQVVGNTRFVCVPTLQEFEVR